MRTILVLVAALTVGGCEAAWVLINDPALPVDVIETVTGPQRYPYVAEPTPKLACRRDGTDEVFRVDAKACPPGSTAGPYCYDVKYKIAYAAPCVGHDVPISEPRFATPTKN